MYDLFDIYARLYRRQESVICIDEKRKQLIRHNRVLSPMKAGAPPQLDYVYAREGTCNIFAAVEPRAGRRVVKVTERRTKSDFARFV